MARGIREAGGQLLVCLLRVYRSSPDVLQHTEEKGEKKKGRGEGERAKQGCE